MLFGYVEQQLAAQRHVLSILLPIYSWVQSPVNCYGHYSQCTIKADGRNYA